MHWVIALLIVVVASACSSPETDASAEGAPADQPPNTTGPPNHDNSEGTIGTGFTLPLRQGESPRVTDGIPHIQLDQTSTPEMLAKLSAWAFSLDGVVEQPSRASLPGAKALIVAPELPIRAEATIVGREFAHIHPNPNGGGSLHLRLPADQANEVVDRGWGEWHPFALDGTMVGMVMVYAPRSDEDLAVVQTIIEAAAAYAISIVNGE